MYGSVIQAGCRISDRTEFGTIGAAKRLEPEAERERERHETRLERFARVYVMV